MYRAVWLEAMTEWLANAHQLVGPPRHRPCVTAIERVADVSKERAGIRLSVWLLDVAATFWIRLADVCKVRQNKKEHESYGSLSHHVER